MRCYQQQTHSNTLLSRSVKKVQAIDVLQQFVFVMCHGLQVHEVPTNSRMQAADINTQHACIAAYCTTALLG